MSPTKHGDNKKEKSKNNQAGMIDNSNPTVDRSTINRITPKKKDSAIFHVLRFFGWWFGFSGLYAIFSVCPFCGQPGCPVGAGTAGLFGVFFASIMKGKTFLSALLSMFSRKRANKKMNNHTATKANEAGMYVEQATHSLKRANQQEQSPTNQIKNEG